MKRYYLVILLLLFLLLATSVSAETDVWFYDGAETGVVGDLWSGGGSYGTTTPYNGSKSINVVGGASSMNVQWNTSVCPSDYNATWFYYVTDTSIPNSQYAFAGISDDVTAGYCNSLCVGARYETSTTNWVVKDTTGWSNTGKAFTVGHHKVEIRRYGTSYEIYIDDESIRNSTDANLGCNFNMLDTADIIGTLDDVTIWNMSSGTPPASLPYAVLDLKDLYDNSSLPDGTVCGMGEVTNTSISGECYFSNQTTGFNYSVGSTNYFTVSGTATENATTDVYLYGAFPSITAYNVENTAISAFNLTTGVHSNTTSTGALNILLPPNSTTDVNVTAPNYYLLETNITTGSQDTAAQNVSGLYQTIVTINATNAYTGALLSNFTGWLYNNDTGFNQSFTTSGNNVTLYGLLANYTAYLDVSGYSIGANNLKTALFNDTTATITFNLYSQNSIFVNIFNEETSAKVTDNVTVTVSGNASEDIYHTTTGSLFLENITDGNYSLKFNSDNYTQRTYTVTVADRSAQTLNAYLSPGTDTVTFNVLDYDSSSNIEGAAILQQRLINSTWTTTESKSTDITGRAQFSYTLGVKYRFTITATGYDTKVFELDPIIFTSYVIRLEKDLAVDDDLGLFDVNIIYYPKSLVNEENNSFTLTFGSVGGSLESYGYSLAYPGGSLIGTGVSANGQTFTNASFLITGASYGDMANLTYWYDSTLGDNASFTYELLIQGSPNDNTAAKLKTEDYGLGTLDKLLIAVGITLLFAGVLTLFGNAVIGLAGGVLFMGYFVFIGFVSIWVALPSFLVATLIIMRRSGE